MGMTKWPSSTRAEITAILTAIWTAPVNCNIMIYTDSQANIDGYKKFGKSNSRKRLKLCNHLLWTAIFDIISTNHITISLKKVKGHSGGPLLIRLMNQLNREVSLSPTRTFPCTHHIPTNSRSTGTTSRLICVLELGQGYINSPKYLHGSGRV